MQQIHMRVGKREWKGNWYFVTNLLNGLGIGIGGGGNIFLVDLPVHFMLRYRNIMHLMLRCKSATDIMWFLLLRCKSATDMLCIWCYATSLLQIRCALDARLLQVFFKKRSKAFEQTLWPSQTQQDGQVNPTLDDYTCLNSKKWKESRRINLKGGASGKTRWNCGNMIQKYCILQVISLRQKCQSHKTLRECAFSSFESY